MSSLNQAGFFLIQIIFNIYLTIIIVRFILQKIGISFHNPIAQFVIKYTQPAVNVLRKLLSGNKAIDISLIVLALVIEIIKLILLSLISNGNIPGILSFILLMLADFLGLILSIYFYAIILAALLSILRRFTVNPIEDALHLMTEPVLKPLRRVIPPIAGLDFTPLVALIIIHLLQILVVVNIAKLVG